MRLDLQGTDEKVADWDGEERPPYHGFVDVDAPREDGIGDEEGVAYSA